MPAYDDATLRTYLGELGIGQPITERIEGFVAEYKALMGRDPEFVFVENFVNNAGQTEFPNLALITKTIWAEFTIAAPDSPFLVSNLRDIDRIFMPKRQDISFGHVTEKSQLTVQYFRGAIAIGYMNAVGTNCEELLELVRRYIIPILDV